MTKYDHMRWGFADKVALVLSIIFLVFLPVWLSLPTSKFISQVSMDVQGLEVEFKRLTPFGSVQARWRSEIVVLDGTEYECNSKTWKWAQYQEKPSNFVSYRIGDWALPCVQRSQEKNVPYTINTIRQVFLWGWLPLWPDYSLDTIEASE